MGPEAGAGGGQLVVEGPPEDIRIHAERWHQQQAQKASSHRKAPPNESLLRSHTGEALADFV